MLCLSELPGVPTPHLTVVFIGRNLPPDVGREMFKASRKLALPISVRLTGNFAKFGPRHNVIVALIKPAQDLLDFRADLIARMATAGIKCKSQFAPHIALPHYCKLPSGLAVVGLDTKIGSGIVSHRDI